MTRPDLSPAQVEKLTEEYTQVIEKSQGKVVREENWGLRHLAYPVNKNKKAHYVLLNLDTPPTTIAPLERQMRLDENIIRYLTIKLDELSDEKSPMMKRESQSYSDSPSQSFKKEGDGYRDRNTSSNYSKSFEDNDKYKETKEEEIEPSNTDTKGEE
jgi:small subunit ribosomal protein S6